MNYSVTTQTAAPRLLAAVHAVMSIREVPARFGEILGKVYSTARDSSLKLDGQNVFIYRDRADGNGEVHFGVGVDAPFATIGDVACVETPWVKL